MTTKEQFQKIAEEYVKGDKGICQISRENNVNLSTFRVWLRKNNLQRTKEQSHLSINERFRRRYENKILDLYDQKWFLKDIALKFGISQNSVSKIIHSNGIKVNRMTRFRPNCRLKANVMAFKTSKEGILNDSHNLSLSEIAQKYGVAESTIRKYARTYNIRYKTHWDIKKEHIMTSYIRQDIKNMAEVARELKCSQDYVQKVLKEANIKTPKRSQWRLGTGVIGKNTNQIKNMYEQGYSLSQLGKLFGCDRHDLAKWVKDIWKLPLRTHFESLKMRNSFLKIKNTSYDIHNMKEKILNSYIFDKLTIRQISYEVGISFSVLQRWLHRWKVEVRKTGLPFGNIDCDDGHCVRSYTERTIDNWLYHNNIIHQTGILIEGISRRFRCDFKVDDIYIEYWGLMNIRTEIGKLYVEKMREKLQFYSDNNLKLISILPKDDFKQKLSILLKHSQVQTQLGGYE